jgi:hypothetical protein
MALSIHDVIKQKDKRFTLDSNAETSEVGFFLQKDLGFTHFSDVDTSMFDQTELGVTNTRHGKLPVVELYDKGSSRPFKAKLLGSLHSSISKEQHMRDFTTLCMSRLVVEPTEVVIKIGIVEVPLHPPTMFNVCRLREALVEKHKSMSILMKF